jgi:hypothetical protein
MSSDKRFRNRPSKHENCVVVQNDEAKMSAKKALKMCKAFEAAHKYEVIRVNPKTVVYKLIK